MELIDIDDLGVIYSNLTAGIYIIRLRISNDNFKIYKLAKTQ